MPVRLTDKETSALAKKMADKVKKIAEDKLKAAAKAKLPEAKKIIATLDALPDDVLRFLYDNRYRRGTVTAENIAKQLVPKDDEGTSYNDNLKSLEADVTLAAHDAKDMATLCKKLGI